MLASPLSHYPGDPDISVYTREFKLKALTTLQGDRTEPKTGQI